MIYVLLNIHKVTSVGCAHMSIGSGMGYGDVIQGHQGVMMEREENWEPSFHQRFPHKLPAGGDINIISDGKTQPS